MNQTRAKAQVKSSRLKAVIQGGSFANALHSQLPYCFFIWW